MNFLNLWAEGTRLLTGWDLAVGFICLIAGVLSLLMSAMLWRYRSSNGFVDFLACWVLLSLALWGGGIGLSVLWWWHVGVMVATGPYVIVSLFRLQLALSVIMAIGGALLRRKS